MRQVALQNNGSIYVNPPQNNKHIFPRRSPTPTPTMVGPIKKIEQTQGTSQFKKQ